MMTDEIDVDEAFAVTRWCESCQSHPAVKVVTFPRVNHPPLAFEVCEECAPIPYTPTNLGA